MTSPAEACRLLRSDAAQVGPSAARVLDVAAALVEVLPSAEQRAEAAAIIRRVVGAYPVRAGVEARVADRLLDFARDLEPIS